MQNINSESRAKVQQECEEYNRIRCSHKKALQYINMFPGEKVLLQECHRVFSIKLFVILFIGFYDQISLK